MLSKILIQSAAVALFAAVVDSQAVPSGEPFFDASDIEDVVPSQYLAPAEVRLVGNLVSWDVLLTVRTE